jgi:hypothetical protein
MPGRKSRTRRRCDIRKKEETPTQTEDRRKANVKRRKKM